jgi:hypothetical protein
MDWSSILRISPGYTISVSLLRNDGQPLRVSYLFQVYLKTLSVSQTIKSVKQTAEWITYCESCIKKRSGHNLRCHPGIHMKEMTKTIKNLRRNNMCPDLDLNPAFPKRCPQQHDVQRLLVTAKIKVTFIQRRFIPRAVSPPSQFLTEAKHFLQTISRLIITQNITRW